MTRYRRKKLTKGDTAAAAVTSAILGIGTAAVAFYVTRLFLSRETLAGGAEPVASPALPASAEADRALPPPAEGRSESGGHDPGV